MNPRSFRDLFVYLKRDLAHHEERIRFLRFIGAHIPKGRVYRLGGRELQHMEIIPVAPRH